jgi:integrase
LLSSTARTTSNQAIIAVLAGSGARRGEVAAPRVDDDLGVGTSSIAPSKAGRPRLASLSAEAREALAAWQAERAVPVQHSGDADGVASQVTMSGHPSGGGRDASTPVLPDVRGGVQ